MVNERLIREENYIYGCTVDDFNKAVSKISYEIETKINYWMQRAKFALTFEEVGECGRNAKALEYNTYKDIQRIVDIFYPLCSKNVDIKTVWYVELLSKGEGLEVVKRFIKEINCDMERTMDNVSWCIKPFITKNYTTKIVKC